MASQIKVDEIAGAAGTTVTIPVGQTLDVLGTLDIDGGTLVLPANVVTTDGTQTLTNKTLTAPKIGTSILDTNGNELILLTATGSAVNEITLANAATGSSPILSATGSDTDIGISIQPKGTGQVTLDQLVFPTGTGTADQILTTDGSGNLSFVDNSGGTSWQAVKTTGFTGAAGEGYFCDTTSGGAFTATLPATPTLGDEITLLITQEHLTQTI
jgi:hypothetical protein